MITVRRADERYLIEHDGIRSRHCFAAGPHFDPENTAFGPLIAVDEHVVDVGARFAEHAHRGVRIASWVLDGTLRHQAGGGTGLIGPGELLLQDAGDGLRHTEGNGAPDTVLRFVQTTWLADVAAQVIVVSGPSRVESPRSHLYVARGSFQVAGTRLEQGDSLRADESLMIDGAGELLVWRLTTG